MNSINYTGNKIERTEYHIVEISYADFSVSQKKELLEEATKLLVSINPHSANTGEIRSTKTQENDVYAGLLAEFATMIFLNSKFKDSAIRPISTTGINQVDIKWKYLEKEYDLEVRSSFVKNGLEFALFAKNPKTNESYFDVIGPYYQKKYKTNYESVKDLFFRVLFTGNKYNIYDRFINNNEKFYIIGAMAGKNIIDENKHKPLTPSSSVQKYSQFDGDYYIAPINKIGDIKQFLNHFNYENCK